MFTSLNLSQHINEVTRPESSTCLDHVYTTHPNYIADIRVPNIGLADHLPVFIRRKYSKKQRNENHITIEYRDFKNVNTDELLEDLQSTPWEAFVFDDINDVLSSIEQMLNDVIDRHIPLSLNVLRNPTNLSG